MSAATRLPRRALAVLWLGVALACALPAAASAFAIAEYPVPTADASPNEIAAGPDGALWYTNLSKPLLGRVDPASGAVEEIAIPYPGAEILTGPDRRLWITMFTSVERGAPKRMVVGVFDPATRQMVRTFEDLTVTGGTAWIATAGGAVWASINGPTAADGRRLVRIDPTTLTTTVHPLPFEGPTATFGCCNLIASAADGRLYVWGDDYVDETRRSLQETLFGVDPAGATLTGSWPAPTVDLSPYDAEAGPDGALWFSNNAKPVVTRFDPATGAWSSVELPETALRAPLRELVVGPDGGLWLTQAGVVTRIDPATGRTEQHPLPTAETFVDGLTVGPDGNLWFTEQSSGNVGRIDLDSKAPDVGNAETVAQQGITALAQCAGPCRASVDAVLLRREGARGATASASASGRVRRIPLAAKTVRLKQAGARLAVLRLSKRDRRRLRASGRSARVQVVVRIRERRAEAPRVVRRTLVLKRRGAR
jgi:streptogramin lyase